MFFCLSSLLAFFKDSDEHPILKHLGLFVACLRKLVLPKYGFEGGPKAFHRLQEHLLSFAVVRPAVLGDFYCKQTRRCGDERWNDWFLRRTRYHCEMEETYLQLTKLLPEVVMLTFFLAGRLWNDAAIWSSWLPDESNVPAAGDSFFLGAENSGEDVGYVCTWCFWWGGWNYWWIWLI